MMDSGDLDPKTELDLLGKEDWEDLVDEIEYDDPAYEQDAALVSDLFRQLASQAASAEPPVVPADPIDPLVSPARVNRSYCSGKGVGGTADFKGWVQRSRRNSRIWVVSGAVGVAAIALLGVWFQNRKPQSGELLPQESFLNSKLRKQPGLPHRHPPEMR